MACENRTSRFWEIVSLAICFLLVLSACNNSGDKKQVSEALLESSIVGKELSQRYCQSCHLYPEPELLDKKTWERSVLPLMGRLFGIYEESVPREEILRGAIDRGKVEELDMFPTDQRISDEEWQQITDYYISAAPDSLESIQHSPNEDVLKGFDIHSPDPIKNLQQVTLIKLDEERSSLFVGGIDDGRGSLAVLKNGKHLSQVIPLPSPPTDVVFGTDNISVTLAGSLRLASSNNAFGELITLFKQSGDSTYSSFSKFGTKLNRPVQAVFEDINGNGLVDILIAEFGYYTGSLTLFENTGNPSNPYTKTILKNTPGAIRVVVEDMNGDGRKDIVCLFAQGDEGISFFLNQGEGKFIEERVLRFPPTFGSVWFELVDFNMDGHLDILYGNGDNGDYPPISKPYHGIRIFENDGSNRFEQVYFYPMYGVNKCSAGDFDQDGILEIIGISFFPDENNSTRRDFVLLKQESTNKYKPQYLSKNLDSRWITFDIGDLDGDGDLDIILGSHGRYIGSEAAEEMNSPMAILENKIIP
ncbi:MAG TPA: VCBS repeat-containing protein [Lunatimonas sp.]|nr:VCBS repeat-containing protein [Lunatimonas sp.]